MMEQKKRVAGDWLVGKERETHSQPASHHIDGRILNEEHIDALRYKY